MKKSLVFLNGEGVEKIHLDEIIEDVDTIIAVDGGANHLNRLNIIPNILIGDMDSVKPEVFDALRKKNVVIITHPVEKDQTDSELAIEYAIQKGYEEIVIVGFYGDRFDHMVANINYLTKLLRKVKINIIHNNEDIYLVDKSIQFHGRKNDEVSLIPLHSDAKGVKTTGLKYKLDGEVLRVASTRGVSNIIQESMVRIQLKKGVLMVIHRHGKKHSI